MTWKRERDYREHLMDIHHYKPVYGSPRQVHKIIHELAANKQAILYHPHTCKEVKLALSQQGTTSVPFCEASEDCKALGQGNPQGQPPGA